jgi:hypothetical protein
VHRSPGSLIHPGARGGYPRSTHPLIAFTVRPIAVASSVVNVHLVSFLIMI